jgi:hypothetical protein
MEQVDAGGPAELRSWADRYLEALGGSGVVAVASDGGYVLKVSRDLALDANQLKEHLGPGGGPPHMVSGKLIGSPAEAFARLQRALQ